jgi:hypothetical protein
MEAGGESNPNSFPAEANGVFRQPPGVRRSPHGDERERAWRRAPGGGCLSPRHYPPKLRNAPRCEYRRWESPSRCRTRRITVRWRYGFLKGVWRGSCDPLAGAVRRRKGWAWLECRNARGSRTLIARTCERAGGKVTPARSGGRATLRHGIVSREEHSVGSVCPLWAVARPTCAPRRSQITGHLTIVQEATESC